MSNFGFDSNTECISIKICVRLIAWNNFRHTVICKTSGTGFWAFYTPKRQAILLKNFMNKLNSAENYFTKLGTPRPEHLPTDWINSYKKTER
jgi:hypothetical protein